MMISAAPGDEARGRADPERDRVVGRPRLRVALADAAEQEDLVVHREPEEDGEEEERHPRLDDGDLLEAEELVPDALDEDEHEQPVGGADREQVHGDGRRGNDDRAEGDRQQDEAEAQHEHEHDREPGVHDVVVVDVLRGRPADEPLGAGAFEGGGDDVCTELAHGRHRRG